MKLIYSDGCICTSLTVDGVETIDMGVGEFRKVIHRLYDINDDLSLTQYFFTSLVDSQGKCSTMVYDRDNIFDDVSVSTVKFDHGKDYPKRNDPHFTHINYNYGEVFIVDREVWDFRKSDLINARIHSLIDTEDDFAVLQGIFCKFLETYGDNTCSTRPCDCCGDLIRTYTYEMEE